MKNKAKRYLGYQIKRMNVRTRQKRKALEKNTALSLLNSEQKDVFELVEMTAKKHPERILYDKLTGEVLIAEENRLFTLYRDSKDCMVAVHNHSGFHSQWLMADSYNYLMGIVDTEAHRYRRKLKHEIRMNIRNFLKGIIEEKQDENTNLCKVKSNKP